MCEYHFDKNLLMGRMYLKRELPPCPDPESYILVRSGALYYWRRKRGTIKPAVLNKALKANSVNAGRTHDAATEIINKLEPFLSGLVKGRLHVKISGKLKHGLNETGILDFYALPGLEMQEDYPLKSMFGAPTIQVSVEKKNLVVSFPRNSNTVKALNRMVTEYYFEIILLHGELLSKKGLRVETDSSEYFSFSEEDAKQTRVSLSLLLPERSPWMVIFRVSCMEGKEPAQHPKHHVMKVLAAGTGRKDRQEWVKI